MLNTMLKAETIKLSKREELASMQMLNTIILDPTTVSNDSYIIAITMQ